MRLRHRSITELHRLAEAISVSMLCASNKIHCFSCSWAAYAPDEGFSRGSSCQPMTFQHTLRGMFPTLTSYLTLLAWSRQCSSLKKCHVSMKQSYADRARDHKMVMMREGPSNEGQMLRSITYTFSISLGSKTNIFPIKSTIPYDPLDLRFRTNTTHSSPTRALA